ncbi:MAG TPA: peptide chain release factor N(5)-glutamine methyltransferase [Actinomycetales bacterium]|nr:peptide chain release factor N(5)-glutamine methyltransferase [Actinomycetales bacterium]
MGESTPGQAGASSDVEPLGAAVRRAAAALAQAGVPSPRNDAEELAAFVLGVPRAQVRTAAVRGDSVPLGARFSELVAERARRTPLQHLTGQAPFRDLVLDVGPGVFVPRPETEVVAGVAVDEAQRLVDLGEHPVVVDLCTGSAAIALAVATEAPASRVHAVELSADALAWATQNVRRTGAQIDLRQGDAATAFDDLDGRVDVVVSNPPYIPPGSEPTDPEVRDHDPEVALYGGGPDGLAVPALVVATAARLLRPGGLLVMEHADVQQATVVTMVTRARHAGRRVWVDVAGHPDLAGRPRYVTARRAHEHGLPR